MFPLCLRLLFKRIVDSNKYVSTSNSFKQKVLLLLSNRLEKTLNDVIDFGKQLSSSKKNQEFDLKLLTVILKLSTNIFEIIILHFYNKEHKFPNRFLCKQKHKN